MAVLAAVEHVAALDPDETALDLFVELHEDSVSESECESIESTAEVLMVGIEPCGPLGYSGAHYGHVGTSCENNNGDQGNDRSPHHDPYIPQALTREQSDELQRINEQALHTLVTGTTPEALAMESAHLATLAE